MGVTEKGKKGALFLFSVKFLTGHRPLRPGLLRGGGGTPLNRIFALGESTLNCHLGGGVN